MNQKNQENACLAAIVSYAVQAAERQIVETRKIYLHQDVENAVVNHFLKVLKDLNKYNLDEQRENEMRPKLREFYSDVFESDPLWFRLSKDTHPSLGSSGCLTERFMFWMDRHYPELRGGKREHLFWQGGSAHTASHYKVKYPIEELQYENRDHIADKNLAEIRNKYWHEEDALNRLVVDIAEILEIDLQIDHRSGDLAGHMMYELLEKKLPWLMTSEPWDFREPESYAKLLKPLGKIAKKHHKTAAKYHKALANYS